MSELGSWLVRAREARGLTLEDAERDTRISRRYLQALESEQFELIPAPVYARGFLRSYSQYLGLDPVEILALFPREDEPEPQPAQAAAGRGAQKRVGQRASPREPISAVGPSRPAWRKPAATAPAAGSARRPAAAPRPRDPDWEPTIGIDIGVPVPARRLQTDPAAQSRSALVAIVAIAALLLVVLGALLIANLGGGDGEPPPDLAAPSALTQGASRTATPEAAAASGLAVTPGVVPDVTGQQAATARAAIAEAGFKPKERRERSALPRGQVIQQAPAAGGELQAGFEVTIVVSDGP